jgi:hypothetical protein
VTAPGGPGPARETGAAQPGITPPEAALGGAATPGAVAAAAVRAAYGVALCCAPGPMLRLAGGPGTAASPGARAVARVLGGRHIVQAVLSAARPTPTVLALGAGTDVLHSASMLMLAAVDRPRWRLGLSDALIAAAFAAGGWTLARHGGVPEAAPLPPLPSLP